jgi:hypothetical protein
MQSAYRYKTVLLILLAITYALEANESAFKLEYRINNDQLTLATPLELTLYLTYPNDYVPDIALLTYEISQQESPLPPPFGLLEDHIESPQTGSNGQQRQQIYYRLQPQQPGKQTLLLPLTFQSQEHTNTTYRIYPAPIHIDVTEGTQPLSPEEWPTDILQPWISPTPVEIDPILLQSQHQDLKDPKRVMRLIEAVKEHTPPWLEALIACICALLLIILHRPQVTKAMHLPLIRLQLSPRAKAIRALWQLKRKTARQHLATHDFYNELEAIIRNYLQITEPLYTLSLTTEEVCERLPAYTDLHSFLKHCSVAKFGKIDDNPKDRKEASKLLELSR